MNTRGTLSISIKYFFPAIRSTKHLVDWLSADYIGFYKGQANQTNMVFLCCLPEAVFDVVRRVFKFLHKIHNFKLIFAFKTQVLM